MNELKGKKFVASYSSGKDSTLSIYKAIQSGMIPMGLIMTYNTDRERSWFHGISPQVIHKLETSYQPDQNKRGGLRKKFRKRTPDSEISRSRGLCLR